MVIINPSVIQSDMKILGREKNAAYHRLVQKYQCGCTWTVGCVSRKKMTA